MNIFRTAVFIGWVMAAGALVTAFPADPAPGEGVVTPAVECRGLKGVTYAVYLPKGYSPDKRWPVLKAAVEWMELQGMRQGRRLQDAALVRRWYERVAAEARRREASGDLPEACRLWLVAAGDYQGFVDGSVAQASACATRSGQARRLKPAPRQSPSAAPRVRSSRRGGE